MNSPQLFDRVNLFSVKGSSVRKIPKIVSPSMLLIFTCLSMVGGPFIGKVSAQFDDYSDGMGGGMSGMMGMGDMMGPPTQPPLQKQIEYLKKARTDEQKETVKQRIRKELGKEYDAYLIASSDELENLEVRLVRLREKLATRKKSKDKLIELELQRIINEVDGLVWPTKMKPRTQSGSMGMGGRQSQSGFQNSFSSNQTQANSNRSKSGFSPSSRQSFAQKVKPKSEQPKKRDLSSRPFTSDERVKNDLRQIGLACFNFESDYMKFPHSIGDEIGTPLLSWRVAILPYIDEMELYEKFHLSEPWDSPHNKKLLAEMPSIYGDNKAEGKTNRLGIADTGGIFEPGAEVGFGSITDGSSNTILCVASKDQNDNRFWTEPSDLTIDQFIEMASTEGTLNLVICDGAVLEISDYISRTDLRLLATRNDGQVVTALKQK